ncbi:hypothetical protein [Croceicoccus mobilis]|nr:hypothetical protein [Croceicoccus mobilis]
MRSELKRGDRVLGARGVVLRHIIGSEDRAMFSDSIVARVRGLASDLAAQLAVKLAEAAGEKDPEAWVPHLSDPLSGALIDEPMLLEHLHSVAMEWQLTESLERRIGMDPALSPLLQALISADDPNASTLAMDLLTGQASFVRHMQRMTLPIIELPAEVLFAVLNTLRSAVAGDMNFEEHARTAEHAIRRDYDEAQTRIATANRLVGALGAGAFAALSVTHAGVAVFLSALAATSGETRDNVASSTGESQLARLALSLRAAGLGDKEIEREFFAIHPDITLPDNFAALRGNDAQALLTGTAPALDGPQSGRPQTKEYGT